MQRLRGGRRLARAHLERRRHGSAPTVQRHGVPPHSRRVLDHGVAARGPVAVCLRVTPGNHRHPAAVGLPDAEGTGVDGDARGQCRACNACIRTGEKALGRRHRRPASPNRTPEARMQQGPVTRRRPAPPPLRETLSPATGRATPGRCRRSGGFGCGHDALLAGDVGPLRLRHRLLLSHGLPRPAVLRSGWNIDLARN